VLFLAIATPILLVVIGLILWTSSHREPNRGIERDDSLFPWVAEPVARPPSWHQLIRRLGSRPNRHDPHRDEPSHRDSS
jgi:hypothetical protein